MKIKIIRIVGNRCSECDAQAITAGCSNWAEVTQEEYSVLLKWSQRENSKSYYNSESIHLALDLTDQVPDFIIDAQAFAQELIKIQALDKKKEEERKAKLVATALERKKKQLEKLKKELESEDTNTKTPR